MGHSGSHPSINEEVGVPSVDSEHRPAVDSDDRQRSSSPNGKDFWGWLPFYRQEGIVDLIGAKKRSGNALRTASRYNIGREISEDYRIDKTSIVGRGMTGTVKLCESQSDPRRKYALKSFQKDQGVGGVTEGQYTMLRTEAEVYLTLDHPNIVRLQDVYEDQEAIHLVMEYCSGGELLQRLRSRAKYSEQEAAQATRQMLLAVAYLHSHNVVHRDLKLENFLYLNEDPMAPLKLIDFGFAKYCEADKMMKAKCGSINYVSPDVLSGQGYTSQCDCWGLGVILFMLLSGYPPFSGKEADVIRRIQRGQPEWRKSRWAHVSEEAVDLVRGLLKRNPTKRLTAKKALEHPWIQKWIAQGEPDLAINCHLSASALRSLHKYSEASRLQRAALQLVAQELQDGQIDELRDVFLAIDREGRGGLNFEDLKTAIRSSPKLRSPRRQAKNTDEQFQSNNSNPDSPVHSSSVSLTGSELEAFEALGRICGLGSPGEAGAWDNSDESDPNSPKDADSSKDADSPKKRLQEIEGSPRIPTSSMKPQIPGLSLPITSYRKKQRHADAIWSGSNHSSKRHSPRMSATRFNSNHSQSSQPEPGTPASNMRRAPSATMMCLFDQLDVNQDGMVDYTDFVAATMTNKIDREECEDAISAAFRRFDVDRSGFITAEDLRNVLPNVEDLDEILREEGVYDGSISYDQFSGIVRGKSKDLSAPNELAVQNSALRSNQEENQFLEDLPCYAEQLWMNFFQKADFQRK